MNERIIDVALVEGLRAHGTDGNHVMVFDEPIAAGGTDQGPTPVQAFLGSLGACAVITIRLYADRKGWDLKDASVKVTLTRPGGNETPRLVQEVHLEGDLDEAQRERLRVIAGRCPVHRLVDGPLETTEVLA
jgi:putative redox protein